MVGGSHVAFYTRDEINSQTVLQESTCFRSRKKGHILHSLIKPWRLPCFKSKALFRLREGGEQHRLWGIFSALKREAETSNMSVVYSLESCSKLEGRIDSLRLIFIEECCNGGI